ncbi:hypothetical protein V493_03246 [Pseudogymnoascus sp. VKM F-4281 (FW-2241)]|nr:hypothetical protein V493_03246 [Pseudogymnoascus sp. VKM F-4281 (FW-2241)]
MLPFTFLMLQKPYMASLVRSFTFRGQFHSQNSLSVGSGDSNDDQHDRLPWPDHPERDNTLRRAIKEISHSEDEELEWYDEVLPEYASRDDALFPLLLISLPNLRRLDFEVTGFEVYFLSRVFDRIASSKPPFDVNPLFTQLSDILLIGSEYKYPSKYALFGACCRLPAVKRVYGHAFGAEDNRPQLRAFTGVPSSLETLELRNSKLQLDDLGFILGGLQSLHTLIYHIGNPWARAPVWTLHILSAFAIHAKSIRRLAINHEEYSPFYRYPPGEIDDRADPLSFVDFTALTHLRVVPVFLFGANNIINEVEPGSADEDVMLNRLRRAFPRNLQSLCITHAGYVFLGEQDCMEKAFGILLRHKECVPNLRELVFEGPFREEESIRRVGQLISLAETMGVHVRAVGLPENTYTGERGWEWDEEERFASCMHNSVGERVQVLPEPVVAAMGGGDNEKE